ncbi:helicase [Elysia marginata]|uniref:Helicase n=1 Tax=Elysia marginata TaxID=1093978 RepID=A0AAV4GZ75_9GAST|nr:helicase [Elysia marginata]
MQQSDKDTGGQPKQNVGKAGLNTSKLQSFTSSLPAGQQATIVPTAGGVGVPTLSLSLPRTISCQASSAQPLSVSAAPLTSTRLVSPQTINLIQRQLSTGIVGLSTVSAQGLHLLQASGTPLTFVTANSPEAAAALQQRKARLLQQQQLQKLQQPATVHHLATPSPANPMSNPNHSQSVAATTMSGTQQTSTPSGLKRSHLNSDGSVLLGTTLPSSSGTTISISARDLKLLTQAQQTTQASILSASTPAVGGPSPKKIKLEVKPALNKETENCRQLVCGHKRSRMREIKSRYRNHLTELFYIQGGGNMTEFNTWKKRPSQPLLNFLEGSKLDSEDEEEPQEKKINDEVKVLTSAGSSVPLATPVAISTTLPASVSALSQQAAMNPLTTTTTSVISTPLAATTSSELHHHLAKSADVKPVLNSTKNLSHSGGMKSIKSNTSPSKARQQSISSVYENVTGGSQDIIVERAKQEAQVLQRVNELRKEGLWSAKRLPRVQEPPRQKAHWDYLLEEMTWLAADFIQERKWKKAAARKLARMVNNHFKEQEQKELRAEKEETIKLKKIASQMAKMVKEFWVNIEKVVQYKQTTRMEEKKRKALDLHLSFIVDQTEKYSSWLTAGLQNTDGSRTSSLASDREGSMDSGEEFLPLGNASDDEETIEQEENESGVDEASQKQELEALQKESELPLEELLKSLPQEMLENPTKDVHLDGLENESVHFDELENKDPTLGSPDTSKGKDDDFTGEGDDESDIEETIEEQETHEKKDYTEELDDLKMEGEMTVEELMKKYSGAYDSDFEMPEESSEGNTSEEEDSSESEKESETSSEEEEESEKEEGAKEEDATKEGGKEEDVGLEFLVKKEGASQAEESNAEGPGKEFNDIAAAAQSLQPKGYTLETTEVKTKVPFLLKHTLREYQHVGLDWLATMHEKRLNGILADEMGLGKTIQTIAMLAHLACEKGVWGPHLIVVPTSVMLNWEMELKKWCPAFKILTYYGSIKERKLKRQGWTKTNAFHVCITSYKLVVQDHQAFRRKKWKYFILDEAQNIKNFKSQRWQMLLNFSSQRRLLLTGTPLQNSLMELWSLMHFLMPNVFQSHSEFKEWFSNPLTGMIEGSQEYNESLVRRLHKVLRPFLLRRLKNEVEKQMPQKFEHVVMCRLSKRQRYLYDDFMSQAKTKETLASGHFMSVINILMQLRKVCNHPNLFDPRPIVSPFKMEGIVYHTASLVTRILEYDPLRDVDIYSLYPNLAEMETDLPAFVAQRVKQLKASGKLIEEVDSLPEPTPRPPAGQLKNLKGFPAVSTPQVGKTLLQSASTPSSKSPSQTVQSTPNSVNSVKLLLPPSSSSSSSSTQQTILIPNPSGSGPPLILPLSSISSTSSSSSAAIAQAKLISSQLQSGALQLVQTSSGHQILTTATSTSTPVSTSASTSSTKSSSLSSTTNSTPQSPGVSLLKLASVQKPVMKVSSFVVSSGDATTSAPSTQVKPAPKLPMKRSELFMESLYRKKEERRQHILALMSRLNNSRCDICPVWGSDTRWCVNCLRTPESSCSSSPVSSGNRGSHLAASKSHRAGYLSCLIAQQQDINHNHPELFWRETSALRHAVHSPEEWLEKLKDTLARFVFVTPTVISPSVSLRAFHPNQSDQSRQAWLESRLRPVIVQGSASLHPIQSRTMVTFPELRLIQYDCGKLQTLDQLLRQLKSGQHRVLIFTQMTKMLDVLEAFLNFHGHRYLRLDGTTKVEQRQYLMDRFNADPRIFCFILSTRSGGIGVNLTGADTVVFYDSDWNPTMDAQAQDRCHRIGQTRDVHIYRLVSEMTVEENILKKANQKRLLGDLAIEGGNFTTAFFKEQTINDLFAEPSGLDALVKEKEREKEAKEKELQRKEKQRQEEKEKQEKEENKKEAAMLTQYEQALCKAEDETDAQAAKQLQAEQKAELAEFDENIPWDEREAELKKEEEEVSKVEMELAMLDKELTPIERYAVTVMEAQMEPETAEELKLAEEDIENSKKDWELARLKALKEEEERRAELEEDEMLYIYSKDESQVKKGRKPGKVKGRGRPCKAGSSSNVELSDDDSNMANPGSVNSRRASERLSPQKLNSPKGKTKSVGDKTTTAKAVVNDARKKIKAAASVLQKKTQNDGATKGGNNSVKNATNGPAKAPPKGGAKEVKEKPPRVRKPKPCKESVSKDSSNDKKPKVVKTTSIKSLPPMQNGHSGGHVNTKLATQARNALLKQQALQAGQLQLNCTSVVLNSLPARSLPQPLPTTNVVGSPPLRPLLKPPTPKTPTDPNVPPPWSNPNLVIRTRKAAVHSPVVLGQARTKTPISSQSVLHQSLTRPPNFCPTTPIPTALVSGSPAANTATVVTLAGSVQQQQQLSGSDRNIFQLFTPSTSSVTLTPTGLRQVAPGVVNQIRGATLINPASLQGARFITTGLAGQPSVVVSAGPRPVSAANAAGSAGSPALTLIPAGQAVGSSGNVRSVVNTARLASPITLQGLSSLPYAVNLIRNSSGNLTLPISGQQQILQASSLAQVAGQPGYVLITPRAPRLSTPQPAPMVSLVQTTQAGHRVQLLTQVPAGANSSASQVIQGVSLVNAPGQAKLISPAKPGTSPAKSFGSPTKQGTVGHSSVKQNIPNIVPLTQVIGLTNPPKSGPSVLGVGQVRPSVVGISNIRPGISNINTIRPGTLSISPIKPNIVGITPLKQNIVTLPAGAIRPAPNQTAPAGATPTVGIIQTKLPTPTTKNQNS